jgi:hypothetical protein
MNADELLVEVRAIEKNLIAIPEHRWVSVKSLRAFNILLQAGLEDTSRDNRLMVVNLLAGKAVWKISQINPIITTKNLSQEMISFLIKLLKVEDPESWELNDYGKELLASAESEIKKLPLSVTSEFN